jgi:hypothetical protein
MCQMRVGKNFIFVGWGVFNFFEALPVCRQGLFGICQNSQSSHGYLSGCLGVVVSFYAFCQRFGDWRRSGFRSTELSVSTELDAKYKPSFKHLTRFFAKRLLPAGISVRCSFILVLFLVFQVCLLQIKLQNFQFFLSQIYCEFDTLIFLMSLEFLSSPKN